MPAPTLNPWTPCCATLGANWSTRPPEWPSPVIAPGMWAGASDGPREPTVALDSLDTLTPPPADAVALTTAARPPECASDMGSDAGAATELLCRARNGSDAADKVEVGAGRPSVPTTRGPYALPTSAATGVPVLEPHRAPDPPPYGVAPTAAPPSMPEPRMTEWSCVGAAGAAEALSSDASVFCITHRPTQQHTAPRWSAWASAQAGSTLPGHHEQAQPRTGARAVEPIGTMPPIRPPRPP